MYSILHRKEVAHDDSIWSVAWGRVKKKITFSELELKTFNIGDDNQTKHSASFVAEEVQDYIVSGGVDDLVKVWAVRDDIGLELIHVLKGHSLGVVSVAISSDSTIIASCSLDSTLRLWNVLTGENLGTMEIGPADVWTVCFSPDDKFIVSGNYAGKIHMYNVKTTKVERTLDTRGRFILSIAYSPDGKYIASGAIDGFIHIFDVESGKLMHTG